VSKFFVNRPIVAIVISIVMTIVGIITYLRLPVAQFPDIVPPEIQVKTTYTGADALTVEQSVATPIEQQMSGVDNMNYMQSVNGNDGTLKLTVNFEVGTDVNTDQILSQMRSNQATSQLPADVNKFGVTVAKSTSSPLIMFALYSPKGTYDNIFLANYANINLNDEFTRVKGIASVSVFGAGQYAMRIWVKPDQLAKLGLTIPEIISAINSQNTVNPAGTIGGEPVPKGQEFTYAVRSQGRLQTPEEFGEIVVRSNPDGSMVRVKDVGRIELGGQNYALSGRLNGKPAALVALYQLPGSNAIAAADGAKKRIKELSQKFPADLDYVVCLDTTLAVTEGMAEIKKTLEEALLLVILVVFIFLQGWRATLIPLLAVPVSLISTFVLFPMFGFTVNTLSLFGLVLAIGLVVDDARSRVHSDSVCSRHHRKTLSAVRRDHRGIDADLGVQRVNAIAGAFRDAVKAQEKRQRVAPKVLQLVQPSLRRSHGQVHDHMPFPDSQVAYRCHHPRGVRRAGRDVRETNPRKLFAGRRPRLFLCPGDPA